MVGEAGLSVADAEAEWVLAGGVVECVADVEASVGLGAWCADWLPLSVVVDEHFDDDSVWWDDAEHLSFELDGAGGGGVWWCDV